MKKVINKFIQFFLITINILFLVYAIMMFSKIGKFVESKYYIDLSIIDFDKALNILNLYDQYKLLMILAAVLLLVQILVILFSKFLSSRKKREKKAKKSKYSTCSQCGHKNKNTTKFCVKCGNTLEV